VRWIGGGDRGEVGGRGWLNDATPALIKPLHFRLSLSRSEFVGHSPIRAEVFELLRWGRRIAGTVESPRGWQTYLMIERRLRSRRAVVMRNQLRLVIEGGSKRESLHGGHWLLRW